MDQRPTHLDRLGVSVIASDRVEPGAIYGTAGVLLIHPLDIIAVEHKGDPIRRLQAAQEWIVGRAHRKLDALAAKLAHDG